MSGMLAKVMNSTVGTNNFKSLDVALTEKIYDKLNSETRLVGSDNVLFNYAGGTWTDVDGDWMSDNDILRGTYDGILTGGFRLSHSGMVVFKTTQTSPADGVRYALVVRDGSGAEIGRALFDVPAGMEDMPFDILLPMQVEAGETYSVVLANDTGGRNIDEILNICGTPVICAPTVTLV